MNKCKYLIGSCLIALAVSPEARAQDAAEGAFSSDIIVTAARREQRLQEVPIAVTALTSETLRDRGIASAADLGSGRVPGLNINSLFGSETAIALNVRGYGTTDPSQGTQDQPVAFYIDGVNLPRSQGMALELITPERIEVLRGPQGQLFGRNAEAGAIQIISRRPSGEFGGDFSGGYGNFETRFLKGSLDLPAIYGFEVQVSGFYRAHDGYLKNKRNPLLQNIQPFTHPLASFRYPRANYDTNLGKLESHGWRVAVERDFGLLNMFYTFDYSEAKDDQGVPQFVTSPAHGTIMNPNGRNDPATFTTTQATFAQPPLDLNGKYPKEAPYSIFVLPFFTKSFGHALTLSLDASDVLTVKGITGFRTAQRKGGNSLSAAVSGVNPSSMEYLRSRTFSQEIQLIYTSDNLSATAGLIYFEEKVKDERDSGFSTNCLPLVSLGIPGGGTGPCDTSAGIQPTISWWQLSSGFRRNFSDTEAYAAYGQASWKPGGPDGKLELTAGARYSDDTKTGRRTINNGAVLPMPILNVARTSRVDPAVMVRYQWTRDINTYARFARGFRDGGANVRSDVFNAYEDESLDSYEIGLKSQWFDRRVTLNVAAFHNIVSNQQAAVQPDPAFRPAVTDTVNLPVKYKTTGVEVELSVRPLSGLQISANYTYLDANTRVIGINLDDLSTFAATDYSFVTSGVNTGALIPSATDIAAHGIRSSFLVVAPSGAPKHAGSISLDYAHSVGSLGNLAFHGEWIRSGKMYVAAPFLVQTRVTAGAVAYVPFYIAPISANRVNLRLALKDIALAGGVKGELSVWGKNIFNHIDGAHAFGSGNRLTSAQTAPQSAFYMQPPRTYGVDLRLQF